MNEQQKMKAKLSSEDKTIIIVTHDTEFLQLVCDRIIRLEKH